MTYSPIWNMDEWCARYRAVGYLIHAQSERERRRPYRPTLFRSRWEHLFTLHRHESDDE